MKKTLTVNLNGRVFNIDEDAYTLLDNYLCNLRVYFRKEEGASEILADFESRIEELFSERVRLGYQVITIEHVEEVIERMGQPADFGDQEQVNGSESEKSYSEQSGVRTKKKFYRNMDDKMFGGICSGLAAYFGWDVVPVRIIAVILLFATTFWIVPIYLLVWLLVPNAKTAEQKLEMRGEAITLENIGKTVAAETTNADKIEKKGFLAGCLDFIVAFMKACMVGLGCLVGIPLIFVLVILIIILFAVLFGVGGGLVGIPFDILGNGTSVIMFDYPIMAAGAFILILAIPLFALIYSIVAYFAKLKPLHSGVKWVGFGAWVVAIILLFSSGFHVNLKNLPNTIRSWKVTCGDWDENDTVIDGNGVLIDRKEILPAFDRLLVDHDLIANFRLEQVSGDTSRVLINGDSDIVDHIIWTVNEGELKMSVNDGFRLNPSNSLIIKIETPTLREVKVRSIGNVTIERQLKADYFSVDMEGAGNFKADSLDCGVFDLELKGVGSVDVGGISKRAKLSMEGAGAINAIELVADTISAKVDGAGAVQCNPIKFLDARVNGVGKITYKKEPAHKQVRSLGIGKIGLE